MRTELIHIDKIPDEQELISLLNENIYECHNDLCEVVNSNLSPDMEIWDYAGRRGKYFHGYRISKPPMSADLYLLSIEGQGVLKCEFHFQKKAFLKIFKQKDCFSKYTQKSIDSCADMHKEYGSYSLEIIMNQETYYETLQDAIQILKIASSQKPNTDKDSKGSMKNTKPESHWDESKQKRWERFVGLCEDEWTNTPDQVKLLELLKGNKDIAIVVNYQLGDSAIDWLHRKVSALGNHMPANCLQSETSKMSLREVLWQMPSR